MEKHIKRIDLTRDFAKHREDYLAAIQEVCEVTAFSGGEFADRFDAVTFFNTQP